MQKRFFAITSMKRWVWSRKLHGNFVLRRSNWLHHHHHLSRVSWGQTRWGPTRPGGQLAPVSPTLLHTVTCSKKVTAIQRKESALEKKYETLNFKNDNCSHLLSCFPASPYEWYKGSLLYVTKLLCILRLENRHCYMYFTKVHCVHTRCYRKIDTANTKHSLKTKPTEGEKKFNFKTKKKKNENEKNNYKPMSKCCAYHYLLIFTCCFDVKWWTKWQTNVSFL